MKFAEKIKNLRTNEKLSQEEFAQKIGVKTNTVWRWETEQTMPQTRTLQKISNTFNIALSELIDNKKEKFSKLIDEINNENTENLHITTGTQTMTYKNGEQELTVPYDRELSLKILKAMLNNETTSINNGVVVGGTGNSGNQFIEKQNNIEKE